ncbi:hypothetical protein L227DRAFT_581891 [Lentinus tigrinus ALCF2SS1-6]|uniref:Secreted protein n=1 Tax=Lentinus tigrinus ALCF2SS1-6 TaxID=1328759 RepID=A0A5C2RQY2_9APHY|nr:hypothetical protein L227DRAFT_581891 [Lentinus tigrinus ALCF2SS1-6]
MLPTAFLVLLICYGTALPCPNSRRMTGTTQRNLALSLNWTTEVRGAQRILILLLDGLTLLWRQSRMLERNAECAMKQACSHAPPLQLLVL